MAALATRSRTLGPGSPRREGWRGGSRRPRELFTPHAANRRGARAKRGSPREIASSQRCSALQACSVRRRAVEPRAACSDEFVLAPQAGRRGTRPQACRRGAGKGRSSQAPPVLAARAPRDGAASSLRGCVCRAGTAWHHGEGKCPPECSQRGGVCYPPLGRCDCPRHRWGPACDFVVEPAIARTHIFSGWCVYNDSARRLALSGPRLSRGEKRAACVATSRRRGSATAPPALRRTPPPSPCRPGPASSPSPSSETSLSLSPPSSHLARSQLDSSPVGDRSSLSRGSSAAYDCVGEPPKQRPLQRQPSLLSPTPQPGVEIGSPLEQCPGRCSEHGSCSPNGMRCLGGPHLTTTRPVTRPRRPPTRKVPLLGRVQRRTVRGRRRKNWWRGEQVSSQLLP